MTHGHGHRAHHPGIGIRVPVRQFDEHVAVHGILARDGTDCSANLVVKGNVFVTRTLRNEVCASSIQGAKLVRQHGFESVSKGLSVEVRSRLDTIELRK